jgi:uncharacterized protein (TIGR03118 family)
MIRTNLTAFSQRAGFQGRGRLMFSCLRPYLDMLEDRRLMTASLVATGNVINPGPVEGTAFTAVVAKFTDSDGSTDPSSFAALINWGDGQVAQGTVATDPAGGFDVSGTHTFAQSGAFHVTAQIGDRDGDSASTTTTNIVAQAPITATAVAIKGKRQKNLKNVTVATFTDADASLPSSAFTALIHWGDGQTTSGMIVANGAGRFKVLGSHKFKKAGAFSVQTVIEQGNTPTTSFYLPTNVMSDGAVAADHVNPNFVNPWGLAAGNPAAIWDTNNGSGTSNVFTTTGDLNARIPVVTIPAPAGSTDTSAPSAIVRNSSTGFVVTDGTNSGAAAFIFATEDGTIAGWNPTVGGGGAATSIHAVLPVDNSASGAVYKGLAILTVPAGDPLAAGQYLFATNFHANSLDVFDSSFHPVTLPAGSFTDPQIPAGFAPFGIQTIGGNLYVTYAKQDSEQHDDVAGPGNGFVDVYSPAGVLLNRLGGGGQQTELNSPWGVIQAPSGFGTFSTDILVGNFGDSHVSAFNPTTGAFFGQLTDAQGQPLALDGGFQGADTKGLWGFVDFPTATGPTGNTLYFASGFNDEADGVFGGVTFYQVATATTTGRATMRR